MPPNGTASFGTFAFVELTFTKANTYETATLKRVVQTQTCTKRPPPNADCLNNRWGERQAVQSFGGPNRRRRRLPLGRHPNMTSATIFPLPFQITIWVNFLCSAFT